MKDDIVYLPDLMPKVSSAASLFIEQFRWVGLLKFLWGYEHAGWANVVASKCMHTYGVIDAPAVVLASALNSLALLQRLLMDVSQKKYAAKYGFGIRAKFGSS